MATTPKTTLIWFCLALLCLCWCSADPLPLPSDAKVDESPVKVTTTKDAVIGQQATSSSGSAVSTLTGEMTPQYVSSTLPSSTVDKKTAATTTTTTTTTTATATAKAIETTRNTTLLIDQSTSAAAVAISAVPSTMNGSAEESVTTSSATAPSTAIQPLPTLAHSTPSQVVSSTTMSTTTAATTSTTTTRATTPTTTMTTTTRYDAESSAESFESAEATSATLKVDPFPIATTAAKSPALEPVVDVASSSPAAPKSPPLWPWMVFVLNGNATVANRRQRDLGTYLRLNLAARLDADYNDVAINRILLTPQAILANISVEPSHLVYGGTGAAGLEALGQGNVTLLELSGHEFQVDRIIRFDEIMDQRAMMSAMEMSSAVSSEVTVYGAVGAVFLFLLVALLLGLSFSSPCKVGDNSKYLSSNNVGYEADQMDSYSEGLSEWRGSALTTPVIYTEQLAREIGDGVLTRSHFIPSSRPSPSPTVTTTLAELHQHHHSCQPENVSPSTTQPAAAAAHSSYRHVGQS